MMDFIAADKRYEYILDCIRESVLVWNRHCIIVYCNKSAAKLFDMEKENIIGKNISELVPSIQCGANEIIPFEPIESTAKYRGTDVPIIIYQVPVVISNINYRCGVFQDITHRKNNEQQIRILNESLKTKVEALEAFQFSVAHDLNAPLRSLEGFSAILMEDYASCLDGTGIDYLKRMYSATKRMRQLLSDLIRLSKVTQSTTELYIEFTNLSEIVQECLDEQLTHNNDNNRKYKFTVQESIFDYVDKDLISIAISNIVSNAWKFTARKEITEIEFGCKAIDGRIVYFITDNGVGFDMKDYDKLFKPFSRLHKKNEFDGNGIGLSIVKQVINLHGGNVWAEGVKDNGATFYFTIGKNNARAN